MKENNLPERRRRVHPKIIKGAGGGGGGPPPCYPSPPPDPHTPKETDEGIYKNSVKVISRTETEVTDLISEGPIEGLVSGTYNYIGNVGQIGWSGITFTPYSSRNGRPWLRSVYWRNVPLIDQAGNFNYTQTNFRYDYGNQTTATSLSSNVNNQQTVNNLPQASRTLSIGDLLRYTPPGTSDFIKNYDFKSTNISALIVSIKIDSLFDQQNNPNRDKQVYNLGCGQVVKISQTLGDIRDRSINVSFKLYKITKRGYSEQAGLSRGVTISGKISSGFIETFLFNLLPYYTVDEPDLLGWRVQVIRTSAESTVLNLRDSATIHAITEVFREDYIYPKTAIFKSLFTTEYFQDVPPRSYDVKLLKVKIPSNYDPIKKTYAGDWDGRFSDEYHPSGNGLYWTDNPAWCYYDLLTNKRYGLGKYIPNANVDKWNLYQIAQYCDTIVYSDFATETANKEPRFTCNAIINDFSDAYSLLNDLTSIFRGMAYYAHGTIYAIADLPKEAYMLFTNSNVENGDFNYSSSSKKVRNTVAVVRYNDITNFAKPAVEYVEDPEAVRKYGIRKVELTAFGCTSRGQAYRLGRWALASEQLETETVDFAVGFDALYLRPGDLIKIQDSNRCLERLAGRVLSISTGIGGIHKFVLDEDYNHISGYFSNNFPNDINYKFSLLTPTYRVTGTNYSDYESGYDHPQIQTGLFTLNNISGVSGYDPERVLTELTCNKVFNTTDYILSTGAVWTTETTGNYYGLNNETEIFRVISVTETDTNRFNVSALEHNPEKYLFIESGVSISVPPQLEPIEIRPAANPSGMRLETGSLFIHYIISGALNPTIYDTAYWNVYMKTGSNFDAGDLTPQFVNPNGLSVNIPRDEYLLDSVNASGALYTISGNFVPTGNNRTYYFRVHGLSSRGYYSQSFAQGSTFFYSNFLADYTNLISFDNFTYETPNNARSTVGLNLPSGNLVNSAAIQFNWELENLATVLKEWTNNDVTYRLDFGTGQFSFPTQTTQNIISTKFVEMPATIGGTSAFTGLESTDLVNILKDNSVSGFWLTIQAKERGGTKYSSQDSIANPLYNQSYGYLFGEFNPQPIGERFQAIAAQGSVNLDNTLSINYGGPSVPDMGSIFVFFTDFSGATGLLNNNGLNNLMRQQFIFPYPSFVDVLSGNRIQLREAFQRSPTSWSTTTPFTRTDGDDSQLLKSGWLLFRLSSSYETELIRQYDPLDFSVGTQFRSGAFTPNSNGTPVAPVIVDYRKLPSGVSVTRRFPATNNIGQSVDRKRNVVNNLMYLNGAEYQGQEGPPLLFRGSNTNLIDFNTFSGLSGYLFNSGDFVRLKAPNNGTLFFTPQSNLVLDQSTLYIQSGTGILLSGLMQFQNSTFNLISGSMNAQRNNLNILSGNVNITGDINILTGRLNITGEFTIKDSMGINMDTTASNIIIPSGISTYSPSGYFNIRLNGTGVRVPYFKY